MVEIADRITTDPRQCGGRPCIRGTRLGVSDVPDLHVGDLSPREILQVLDAIQHRS